MSNTKSDVFDFVSVSCHASESNTFSMFVYGKRLSDAEILVVCVCVGGCVRVCVSASVRRTLHAFDHIVPGNNKISS